MVGSTRIVEGDFYDCLAAFKADIEEGWKVKGRRRDSDNPIVSKAAGNEGSKHPVVYLANLVRYQKDAPELYDFMKQICTHYGLRAITPCDWAEGMVETGCDNIYAKAANLTENYLELIKGCDAVIADLNNYRGYECANDVGFECGMGFELDKKLFGYMDDTRACIHKIPHLGENLELIWILGNM